MGQEAARRGRHLGLAARRHRSCRRHPGRRWRRRPAAAAEAALLLAQGRVRGQRLRPAAGPARLLPARPDPGHRAPARRQHRLRPAAPAMGGGADARLARPVAPPRQGVRGTARGLRDHGQAGHDPAHAAPPRPPEPQAPARSLTSQTASYACTNLAERLMGGFAPWEPLPGKRRSSPALANKDAPTVYVAYPASDVRELYLTMTSELQARGIKVVPEPEMIMPLSETEALKFIERAE